LISVARPPTALSLPVRLRDFGMSTPAAPINYNYIDPRPRVRGSLSICLVVADRFRAEVSDECSMFGVNRT
jgi:hypothetical protein